MQKPLAALSSKRKKRRTYNWTETLWDDRPVLADETIERVELRERERERERVRERERAATEPWTDVFVLYLLYRLFSRTVSRYGFII